MVSRMTGSTRNLSNSQRKQILDKEDVLSLSKTSQKSEVFQLFFLEDDESLDVEVVETKEIDFREVIERLMRGESIFITRKNLTEMKCRPQVLENTQRPPLIIYI